MSLKSVLLILFTAALPVISFAGSCDNVAANDQLIECLGKEFSKADASLNKAYNELRTRLTPDGKDLLKKGQMAWLAYRDSDCEFQAMAAAGGQAYQPTYISCRTNKTSLRAQELKKSGW